MSNPINENLKKEKKQTGQINTGEVNIVQDIQQQGNMQQGNMQQTNLQQQNINLAAHLTDQVNVNINAQHEQLNIEDGWDTILTDAENKEKTREFKGLYDTVMNFEKQFAKIGLTDEEREIRLYNIIKPYKSILKEYTQYIDQIHFGRRHERIMNELGSLARLIRDREAREAEKNDNEGLQEEKTALSLIKDRAKSIREKEKITKDLQVTVNRDCEFERPEIMPMIEKADRLIVMRAKDGRINSGFIEQFLSMTPRQRLMAYYLIEHKKTDAPTELDVAASQMGSYKPNAEKIQSRLRSKSFYIKNFYNTGVHTNWDLVGSAMRMARANGATIDKFAADIKDIKERKEAANEQDGEKGLLSEEQLGNIAANKEAHLLEVIQAMTAYRDALSEAEEAGIFSRKGKKKRAADAAAAVKSAMERLNAYDQNVQNRYGTDEKLKGYAEKYKSAKKEALETIGDTAKIAGPNIAIVSAVLAPIPNMIAGPDNESFGVGQWTNMNYLMGALSTAATVASATGLLLNAMGIYNEIKTFGMSEMSVMDHIEKGLAVTGSVLAFGKAGVNAGMLLSSAGNLAKGAYAKAMEMTTSGGATALSKCGSAIKGIGVGAAAFTTASAVVGSINVIRQNVHGIKANDLFYERMKNNKVAEDDKQYEKNLLKLENRVLDRRSVGKIFDITSAALSTVGAVGSVAGMPILTMVTGIAGGLVSLGNMATQAIMKHHENKHTVWEFTGMEELVSNICKEKNISDKEGKTMLPYVEQELLGQLGFESKAAFLGYIRKNYGAYIFNKLHSEDEAERNNFIEIAKGFGVKVKYEGEGKDRRLKHPSSPATIIHKMSK